MKIRFATDHDGTAVAALIDRVLQEYGDRACLEPDGSEGDVLQIRSAYFDKGGAFWVLESEKSDEIIGSNAIKPSKSGAKIAELKRMYLAQSSRGSGAAKLLLDAALSWAAEKNFNSIELWTDSRFQRGHRFYEKQGFERTGNIREMNDSFQSYSEFHFSREL
jgi:putative acetyltransferase